MKKPDRIPAHPGVYLFKRGSELLYIGKAANLRQRLASYFTKDEGRTPKVKRMLEEATRLEIIETPSEIDALLKEAELIKKLRPKYNILMRDDKSYFYVAVTRETFPRIFVTHQPRGIQKSKFKNQNKSQTPNSKRVSELGFRALSFRCIGPFTSGTPLVHALKLLRRVFPYCTCREPHKRPCLNSQIGRCPGACCVIPRAPVEIRRHERSRITYRKNIRSIIAVLRGERTRLMRRLARDMRRASRAERYEEATRLRDALAGLENVFSHRFAIRPEAEQRHWTSLQGKLGKLFRGSGNFTRIEGYDIANIGSEAATGSMVVFTNGTPDKSQYRKFRIKTVRGISDVAMHREVLRRRFLHADWQSPNIVVVDGGKAQLNAALAVIREIRRGKKETRQPIVTALAKREETLYIENGDVISLRREDPDVLHLFQRIRDESHRFARAYHHKLRGLNFRPTAS